MALSMPLLWVLAQATKDEMPSSVGWRIIISLEYISLFLIFFISLSVALWVPFECLFVAFCLPSPSSLSWYFPQFVRESLCRLLAVCCTTSFVVCNLCSASLTCLGVSQTDLASEPYEVMSSHGARVWPLRFFSSWLAVKSKCKNTILTFTSLYRSQSVIFLWIFSQPLLFVVIWSSEDYGDCQDQRRQSNQQRVRYCRDQ